MTNSGNPQVVSSSRPIRERVGLIVDGANAAAAVKTIVAAEDAGVRQIWMGQPPNLPDALTTFAAAGSKNIYSKPGNIYCTDLSTSSACYGPTGIGFTRSCTWSVATWNRPQS